MGKYVCMNCGVKIRNETGENNHWISSGICQVCWELRRDIRKYAKLGMGDISGYLKAVLSARKNTRQRR